MHERWTHTLKECLMVKGLVLVVMSALIMTFVTFVFPLQRSDNP